MSKCVNEEVGRLITLYELGRLSNENRDRFEAHLMKCGYCFREVEVKMPIIDVLREYKAEILEELQNEGMGFKQHRRELLKLHREERLKRRTVGNVRDKISGVIEGFGRRKTLVPVAAVAVALILLFTLPYGPQPLNPYLTCLNFEKAPYKLMQPRAAAESEAQGLFITGMNEYLQNDFKGAVNYLTKAVERSPNEGPWWLYLGVSLYLDRQAKPALIALIKAETLTDYSLKYTAQWYLAQAHLLAADADRAIPLLEGLATLKKDYAEDANALLVKVRSIEE